VVDVSGSMAATDVTPYRLRAAQDAALTFAEEVPRQYQVGLVSFSGQANLLVAPTTDRQALKRGIDGLVHDGAPAVGDACSLGDPLMTARTEPTLATLPSDTRISTSVPAIGDGTSESTLSVDTSKSGSSTATASPGCLNHRVMVPSVTVSPSWGMVTSTVLLGLPIGRAFSHTALV
jgi:Ca-activated chloride channel family protein